MRPFLIFAIALGSFTACNTTQSQDRRSGSGKTTDQVPLAQTSEVKFILPGSLAEDSALELTHYNNETQWQGDNCKVPEADKEMPFTGRDIVRLSLTEGCDYRVNFQIGFYAGTAWNAVYAATMIVDPKRDSTSAMQVFVERTTDGVRLGFPADLKPLIDIIDQSSPPPTADGDGIVEFRISAGTGSGAWNSQASILRIKVGQTLRIYNDDSISHQLHTDGAPCPHGEVIPPGGFADCYASRPYSGSPLYDHNTLGSFFIEALP